MCFRSGSSNDWQQRAASLHSRGTANTQGGKHLTRMTLPQPTAKANSPIRMVVLDEATSALPVPDERNLYKSLEDRCIGGSGQLSGFSCRRRSEHTMFLQDMCQWVTDRAWLSITI